MNCGHDYSWAEESCQRSYLCIYCLSIAEAQLLVCTLGSSRQGQSEAEWSADRCRNPQVE